METTEEVDTVKLVLPLPYYLWMCGMNPCVQQEESVQHEPQAENEV